MKNINSNDIHNEKELYTEQKKALQDAIARAEDKMQQAYKVYEMLENDASVDDETVENACAKYEQAYDLYYLFKSKCDAMDNIIHLLDRLQQEVEYLETC
jgi:flavin-binding protein dodecin